jgi:hypothetical protein
MHKATTSVQAIANRAIDANASAGDNSEAAELKRRAASHRETARDEFNSG